MAGDAPGNARETPGLPIHLTEYLNGASQAERQIKCFKKENEVKGGSHGLKTEKLQARGRFGAISNPKGRAQAPYRNN